MRRGLLAIGVAIVVVGGAAMWWGTDTTKAKAAATPAAPPAVPAAVETAKTADVPVYLTGLGTVQAFNSVEVRAQVQGVLLSVPVKEGEEVHKGDVVAEIDPAPYRAALDQATAQRAEDAASLQSQIADLHRYQSLAKNSFAPIQQVDDQQALVNKTAAAIQADSAAIETARINLDHCTIHAPIDGRISLYQVDIGNLIQVGATQGILSIAQDRPIAVVFTLPEEEFVQVQTAMAARALPVTVFSSEGHTKLAEGTLMAPNNAIDTATGTISLKARFDNADDHLWPGGFVQAAVQVDTLHDAVTVPIDAIQHGPNGLFVYTVKPDHTVQSALVTVSIEQDGRAVVTKGVQAGDTVVTTGQSRLSPGARIQVPGATADAAPAAHAG